jgi:hypothetical protein
MDFNNKKIKSLRNIRKEAVCELKLCPQKLTNDYFYSFMRLNAFKLSNNPAISKPSTPIPSPNPLNKHNRDPHQFLRSCSPTKRKPLLKRDSRSSSKVSSIKLSINQVIDLQINSTSDSIPYDEKEFSDLCMLNNNLLAPDYRKKYDRMFRGKISRKYLKF